MIFVLNRRLESIIEKLIAVVLKLQKIAFILGLAWFIVASLSNNQSMYDNMSNAAMMMVISISIMMTLWLIRFLLTLYKKSDFIVTSDNKYYTISVKNKTDLSKIVQQADFRQTVSSLIDKMENDRQTRLVKKTDFGTIRLQQYKGWKICIETKNNEYIVGIDKWDRDGQQLGRESYREKQFNRQDNIDMSLSKLRIGTWDDLIRLSQKIK